jgi:16S rRNA (guanine966-N2)-methyltransferase
MVEKDPAALRALRGNASKLGASNLTVVRGDALEFARETRSRFDVVFVDPPYRSNLQAAALSLIRGLLSRHGRVYAESASPFEPPRGWTVLKSSRAGNVHFYLLAGDADDQSGVSGNV